MKSKFKFTASDWEYLIFSILALVVVVLIQECQAHASQRIDIPLIANRVASSIKADAASLTYGTLQVDTAAVRPAQAPEDEVIWTEDAERAWIAIMRLKPKIDPYWADQLAVLIADEFGDLDLVDDVDTVVLGVALCFAESSFNPDATNPATRCAGLFQLHPMHGIADAYNPAVNVHNGALKLQKYCHDRGSLRGGLKRYGTNVGRVMKIYKELLDG
jgi:hypothetical protein